MKIEFFHDVICSFCFPMSANMRQIDEKYDQVEIIHRSFALGYKPEHFIQVFGSRQAVKDEVVSHWEDANKIDEKHRFNIEGMKEADFDFPTSRLPLIAAKAAGLIGDQYTYWEAFDALQHGLFVENRNIEETEVIESIIAQTSLYYEAWHKQFYNPESEEKVLEDLDLCRQLHIFSAPSLVVEDKYLFKGALPVQAIERRLEKVAETEGLDWK